MGDAMKQDMKGDIKIENVEIIPPLSEENQALFAEGMMKVKVVSREELEKLYPSKVMDGERNETG